MSADEVPVARSARVGDEIGGHNVSGHIYTTGKIQQITKTEDNRRIAIQVTCLAFTFCNLHLLYDSGLRSQHSCALLWTMQKAFCERKVLRS